MIKYYFYLILIVFSFSYPCKEGTNYCSRCNPVTKLCEKCEKDIFIPDNDGGCEVRKKCSPGENYCLECQDDLNVCKLCEDRYFPDEIGGCSYTNDCEISYKGECIKCKEDLVLIGQNIKVCKSIYSEDLKNCDKINLENGFCESCKEGFYLNTGDKKCSRIQNCQFSSFGICNKCASNYYLDIKEAECKLQSGNFLNCKQTIDGQNCDICDDDYYPDEEGKCISINFCLKKGLYEKCEKCMEGYFPSKLGECTKEKNCYEGNKNLGICIQCESEFYIDFQDGKCKSNREENDFKYCRKANGDCYECSYGTYLGNDKKCSLSKNCAEASKGICIQCLENYHLGLDNKCTNIDKCIYSDFYGECTECENNNYYNRSNKLCEIEKENFENCKITTFDGNFCDKCKKDFYYNRTKHLCFSNKEGDFYKCAYTSENGDYCVGCIEDYYLGDIDHKCSLIEGCDISENENKCIQCYSEEWCLDLKTGKCEYNKIIEDENKKFYYKCNRTNEEGNACDICIEGFELKNGLCVDNSHCVEKNEEGNCQKCITYEEDYYYHCLNKYFGCIETYFDFCEKCDNLFDFDKCTKCFEGYNQNEKGECIKIQD